MKKNEGTLTIDVEDVYNQISILETVLIDCTVALIMHGCLISVKPDKCTEITWKDQCYFFSHAST